MDSADHHCLPTPHTTLRAGYIEVLFGARRLGTGPRGTLLPELHELRQGALRGRVTLTRLTSVHRTNRLLIGQREVCPSRARSGRCLLGVIAGRRGQDGAPPGRASEVRAPLIRLPLSIPGNTIPSLSGMAAPTASSNPRGTTP
jgi:hypothetical protein